MLTVIIQLKSFNSTHPAISLKNWRSRNHLSQVMLWLVADNNPEVKVEKGLEVNSEHLHFQRFAYTIALLDSLLSSSPTLDVQCWSNSFVQYSIVRAVLQCIFNPIQPSILQRKLIVYCLYIHHLIRRKSRGYKIMISVQYFKKISSWGYASATENRYKSCNRGRCFCGDWKIRDEAKKAFDVVILKDPLKSAEEETARKDSEDILKGNSLKRATLEIFGHQIRPTGINRTNKICLLDSPNRNELNHGWRKTLSPSRVSSMSNSQ